MATQAVRHVGVNAVFLQERMGGIETYVRRLVPALLEERPDLRVSLFVNTRGRALLQREPWSRDVRLLTHPLLGRAYTRALTELTLLGWLASRERLDVLHSVALTAPLRTRAATVLTIADLTWLRDPDPAERLTTTLWRAVVPPVARRTDRVIVLAEATKQEVIEDLRVPAERIDVVPLGPGVEPTAPTPEGELRAKLGLDGRPFALAVSALKAHKNVDLLIDALAEVRRSHDLALVVPGNRTHHYEELVERARELGIGDAVVFPGWVDDADLEALYRAAACFVFPSRREGFGLPVLEAMRRGVPVACANASAVPEVAGDAALYFDPSRPDEIAAAIRRLLEDRALAETLARKGRERQAQFTWRAAARGTLASYERAVGGR